MDSKEVKEDLDRFENLIKMINFEYTQFFLGNKQHPPLVYEREINKLIKKYNITQLSNTTLRFRFNNLVARYITFREKWSRKMMEHEGTKKPPTEKQNIQDKTQPFYQKELDKIPEKYDKSKVVDAIESKIDKLKNNGYDNVYVNIDMKNGKIKLKIRPKS